MVKYVIKRVLLMIPVVLAVILLVFSLLYITPGSTIERMRSLTGDRYDGSISAVAPGGGFFAKYLRYCINVIFKFDFGDSYGRNAVTVSDQLKLRWGWTLRLSGWSLLVSALIGIPAGIVSALHANKWQDRAVSAVSTLFSSIPSYCLAIGLALLFALKLGLFPSYGVQGRGALVLPVVTISAMGICQFIRVVRASVSESLGKNYITALKAAGFKKRVIIGVHALRNALVPITASLGETAAKILGGTFIAEKFFAVPGVGFYLITAISQVDFAVILACTSSTAIFLVLIGIVTDVISLAADPRLRKKVTSKGAKGR